MEELGGLEGWETGSRIYYVRGKPFSIKVEEWGFMSWSWCHKSLTPSLKRRRQEDRPGDMRPYPKVN